MGRSVNSIDLTRGPVIRSILLFALPIMAGNVLQLLYNVADTIIVGRFLGTEALAAVGASFSLMTFVTSVILGLCMGSGALFSILYGRESYTDLRRCVFASFVLIGIVAAAATVICYALTDSFRTLLQVPDEAWPDMRDYLTIVFCGIPAVFLYNYYTALLRAVGNSLTPLVYLGICAGVNVALDLWFVAGLGLGTGSAAAATAAAQWLSGTALAIHAERRQGAQYALRASIREVRSEDLRQIASFSFLTCLQQSVMNLGILMVQGLVNSFGVPVMAAFSAAVKIDAFAYMPVQDFGNAFSTFAAQNYGARQPERIRHGFAGAAGVSAAFSAAASAIVCMAAPLLMEAFVASSSADVITIGVQYLRIEGPFYFAIGILFLLYGLYRAVGRPGFSVVLTLFSLGTRVALAYVLSAVQEIGITGIWWSVPIGWGLADAVGLAYYAVRRRILLAAPEQSRA